MSGVPAAAPWGHSWRPRPWWEQRRCARGWGPGRGRRAGSAVGGRLRLPSEAASGCAGPGALGLQGKAGSLRVCPRGRLGSSLGGMTSSLGMRPPHLRLGGGQRSPRVRGPHTGSGSAPQPPRPRLSLARPFVLHSLRTNLGRLWGGGLPGAGGFPGRRAGEAWAVPGRRPALPARPSRSSRRVSPR